MNAQEHERAMELIFRRDVEESAKPKGSGWSRTWRRVQIARVSRRP